MLSILFAVSIGHAYFQNNEISISWQPAIRPAMVSYSCETTLKHLGLKPMESRSTSF